MKAKLLPLALLALCLNAGTLSANAPRPTRRREDGRSARRHGRKNYDDNDRRALALERDLAST